MSNSYRKPILKYKPRNYKRTSAYWRPVRRVINQIVSTYKVKYDSTILDLRYGEDCNDLQVKIVEENSIMLGTELPNPKTIINNYNYCDYIDDYRFCHKQSKKWWRRDKEELLKEKIKFSRK